MGISGGIFLIALGAVLTFALEVDPWWIDVEATGVIVMLAGGVVLLVTAWYWQNRRRAAVQHRPASPAPPRVPRPPPDAGRPSKSASVEPPSASGSTDGT